MQVVIDEVVNRIRAVSAESVLAPETLRQVTAAVLAAVEARERHGERVAEERSLQNHQQRNRHWNR